MSTIFVGMYKWQSQTQTKLELTWIGKENRLKL
jgi:hypothetical protein